MYTFNKILELLAIERERMPLFCPVILGIGILVGVYHPFQSPSSLAIFIGISIILFIVFKSIPILRYFILIVSLGVYISQTGGVFGHSLLANKAFIEREYNNISFTADVGFIEETHPTMKNMQRLTLSNIECARVRGLSFVKTSKMTCSSKLLKGISPNDHVKVVGRFIPYKSAVIPGSFDQLQYNSLIKMDAAGVIFRISIDDSPARQSHDLFSYMRFHLTSAISNNINGRAGGVAAALLTGDKSAISQETRDYFINSGTAHILAISGLHMSIVAGIIFFILFRLSLYMNIIFPKINPRKVSAILTIIITFLYLGISGFSPSAIRAFIMTTVVFTSMMLERGAVSLRSVSFAAFAILLFDPASLFLISFQLSFSAVVALVAFYERYGAILKSYGGFFKKFALYVSGSAITTIIASIATIPISIYTFNRLSLSGILGNLIAIPMTGFLLAPLGIMALIFGGISHLFPKIFGIAIEALIKSISFVSSLPGSNIIIKSPETSTLYALVFGGIILSILQTKLRHIGSLISGIAFFVYIFEKKPDIIFVPGEDVVCHSLDGTLFATSSRRGKGKIQAIQRNIGLAGEVKTTTVEKIPFFFKYFGKIDKKGLFIWTKHGKIVKMKQLTKSAHPYCPVFYEDYN